MSLDEQLKANKRLITKAIRELDRERTQLERDQARLQMEIKKLAAQNQMSAVRVAAKDLVRTKAHIAKFYQMRSNMQGLNLKLQTMKSSHEMAQAMGKMSKAMKAMNKAINVPKMQELMMEFQRQEMAMGMTQEMMDDVVDDVLTEPGSAEAEEALVKQVLDELGVNLAQELQEAPQAPVKTAVAAHAPQPVALDSEVSDLEARLENLRRDG